MRKKEIYARLRNSDVFADSKYFDYAWLMLGPKDFEQKTFQRVSEIATKKMNANAFLNFVKKAKQVSIENKANGEVLRIISTHVDDQAILQFLTKRIENLLNEHAKAFEWLDAHQEFLVLLDDEEIFNLFIQNCLKVRWSLTKKRNEDLFTWRVRIKELLWSRK